MIVWHAAELSVTMVCIGIPVCRPLYKNWFDRNIFSSKRRVTTEDTTGDNGVYTLHTIGGSEFNKNQQPADDRENDSDIVLRDDIPSFGPNQVVIKSSGRSHSITTSQESILGAESRDAERPSDDTAPKETNTKGILVKTEFGTSNKTPSK